MKQVIEWKKIPSSLQNMSIENKEYYFKAKNDGGDSFPIILSGYLKNYDGKFVAVSLGKTWIDIPLSEFSHYAEVEGE